MKMNMAEANCDSDRCESPESTRSNDTPAGLEQPMFRNIRAMIEEDNSKKFEREISDIVTNENERVYIFDIKISELPEIFKTFTFVKEMYLQDTLLNSLNNLPPNLRQLKIINGDFEVFDGKLIPSTVTDIIFKRCSIKRVINLQEGIKKLDLNKNSIEFIESEMPESLIYCNLSDNDLKVLPKFKNNLRELFVNDTKIESIDDLPDSVLEIYATSNSIPIINNLPKALEVLKIYKSEIIGIKCKIPDSVRILDLYDNNLRNVPNIPNSIVEIDLTANLLNELPSFKHCNKLRKLELGNIKDIKLSKEQIKELHEFYMDPKIEVKIDESIFIDLVQQISMEESNPTSRALITNISEIDEHYRTPTQILISRMKSEVKKEKPIIIKHIHTIAV